MDALTALRNVAAIQAARTQTGRNVGAFLKDRCDYYTSHGIDRTRAIRLAREDASAQY
jgi:hypothetical protein